MQGRSVYVVDHGERDLSRWLVVQTVGDECYLGLEELTHPGMPSSLRSVRCPLGALRDVLAGGYVQIRTEGGYCILQGREGMVELQFRGDSDASRTCCDLSREDLALLVEANELESAVSLQ